MKYFADTQYCIKALNYRVFATVGSTKKYLYRYKAILIILNIRIHGEGKNLNNSLSLTFNGISVSTLPSPGHQCYWHVTFSTDPLRHQLQLAPRKLN